MKNNVCRKNTTTKPIFDNLLVLIFNLFQKRYQTKTTQMIQTTQIPDDLYYPDNPGTHNPDKQDNTYHPENPKVLDDPDHPEDPNNLDDLEDLDNPDDLDDPERKW